MFKNVNLSQDGKIILDSNQLQNNKGNNIWIERVNRRGVQSLIKSRKDESLKNTISTFILHSRIYDAELGFGVYASTVNC